MRIVRLHLHPAWQGGRAPAAGLHGPVRAAVHCCKRQMPSAPTAAPRPPNLVESPPCLLPCPPRQKAAAQGCGPVQPRGYQARFIAVARGGGNFIFVAPTNSGKTLVAQEHAAHVLSRDPAARVVFVAPTVALATQQAGEAAGTGAVGWLAGSSVSASAHSLALSGPQAADGSSW